jgi:hypothetical protein
VIGGTLPVVRPYVWAGSVFALSACGDAPQHDDTTPGANRSEAIQEVAVFQSVRLRASR